MRHSKSAPGGGWSSGQRALTEGIGDRVVRLWDLATGRPILVVGEAPAADGWWATGRAFYRRTAAGGLVLSRTGVNLNDCLAVLGTAIEEVGFVEAVRWRPDRPGAWHPGESVRRRCRPFLERHLVATQPRLVLPLGLTATASCLEVAFARRPATLESVAGTALEWPAPWGSCWILPLYHPSPANGSRWRRNKLYLRKFLKDRSDPAFSAENSRLSGSSRQTISTK